MIRGLQRIVRSTEVEPGRFYLRQQYNDDPALFQCVQTGETIENAPELKAMRFAPGSPNPLGLEDLPHHEPVVELPEVHIRVDAPSLVGSSDTSGIRSGMFLIGGNEAYVAAPLGFRHWGLVNISTGRVVQAGWSEPWVAFSRWLLVIDDEKGEEIPIASFGESEE